MESILFSLEAVSSILSECYRKNNNCETGGILIGPKKHNRVVTEIIPSTIYAERRPATFYQSKKDVEILNQKLKSHQAKGYDFKGYFHKHPSGMFQLSHGDIQTSKEILRSSNYKINNFLIMMIITESYIQDSPLFSYVVRKSNKEIIVGKNNIKVLPKACISECAECFEPSKKGACHESINFGQDNKGIKGENNTIRNSGKGNSDNKLTQK